MYYNIFYLKINTLLSYAGSLIDMPAVRIFTLYAGLAVLIDFILQVTCFVALLSLDARRRLVRIKKDYFFFVYLLIFTNGWMTKNKLKYTPSINNSTSPLTYLSNHRRPTDRSHFVVFA